MQTTTKTIRRITNDTDESYYEVSPDRDGLGCVEVTYYDSEGKACEHMTYPPEIAKEIAKAMDLCRTDLENNVQR